jgi:hypothetical protein
LIFRFVAGLAPAAYSKNPALAGSGESGNQESCALHFSNVMRNGSIVNSVAENSAWMIRKSFILLLLVKVYLQAGMEMIIITSYQFATTICKYFIT